MDDKKTEIYRANFAFQAVAVSEGKHTIVFNYRPKSFYLGLAVSVSTVILLSIIFLVRLIKTASFQKRKGKL